jgi:acyl carrier protein
MNRDDVLAGVRECVASALDADPKLIEPQHRLIDDLGADSLDLLDLSFQLEQRFKVAMSPREIERRAKQRLGGRPLDVEGVYTPEALTELRRAMPEVPPEDMPNGLTTADLPKRLRVETLVNTVCQLLEDKRAG